MCNNHEKLVSLIKDTNIYTELQRPVSVQIL